MGTKVLKTKEKQITFSSIYFSQMIADTNIPFFYIFCFVIIFFENMSATVLPITLICLVCPKNQRLFSRIRKEY
jgi:hypothetical protein